METKNFSSDYDVRLATLAKLGGDATKNYSSVYDIDIEILKLTGQGGGGLTPEEVKAIVEDYNYTTMAAVEAKGYATEAEIPSLDGYATEQWVEDKNYLTEHQDLSNYATKDEIPSLDGYAKISKLTQAEYDALATKDDSTIYIITDAE